MKKIAVLIAGSGHRDGSEITEVVSTLISITAQGAQYQCFAPEINFHPKNHLTNKLDESQTRNTLIEAARIARGQVKPLDQLVPKDFDALILPGGSGAAQHFCDWATQGARCKVLPELEKIILDFHKQSKPMGFICIAPVIAARVLGQHKVTITIGHSPDVIKEVLKTGAEHETCPTDDYITDRDNKVVTTPAYMDDALPHQVFRGISGLVKEVVEMA